MKTKQEIEKILKELDNEEIRHFNNNIESLFYLTRGKIIALNWVLDKTKM